jgi:ribosome-associated protein
MAKTVKKAAARKGAAPRKGDRKLAKAGKPTKFAKPARGPKAAKAKGFKAASYPGGPRSKPKAGSLPRGIPRRPETKKIPKRPPGPLKQKALQPLAPADEAALAPRPAEEKPDPARPLAMSIAQAGLDKKAEDVLVLDVRGLTSYADYFVVMTADSERQASAIADHLDDQMKKQGTSRVGSEGYESGRWILIDYGDVVAHVMSREARGFYDLEGLWADAQRFPVAG